MFRIVGVGMLSSPNGIITFCKILVTPRIFTIRRMSVYPKYYVNPIISKNVEKHNYINLAHVPIKAAKNDDSLSIFRHEVVNKMINYITRKGKKKLARELLERSFECIKKIQIQRLNLGSENDIETDPRKLLLQAIENSRPVLQLTKIKRGGVTYQVPVPVTEKHSYFLAMKWILESSNDKDRKVHLPEKLAWEILDASRGQGRVVKRKDDLHKQCENNRAYAHYRWS